MRKLETAALAIPVIVAVYLATLLRRTPGRIALGAGVAGLIAIVVIAGLPPARSTAVPRSVPRAPVAADFTSSIRVGHELLAPIQVRFSAPMDAAAVAAAVRISPAAPVHLAWSEDGTLLSVQPVEHWEPDTLYTVVVGEAATDIAGTPLGEPIRAAFLTADGGFGRITATRMVGDRASLATAFDIVLDRPVDAATAQRALRVEPSVEGSLAVVAGPDGGQRLTFQPAATLLPGTTYAIAFDGLVDADGVPFTETPSLTVTTGAAPTVVRFRPRNGTEKVAQDAAVSVRFTEPMARKSTAAAFSVKVNGTAVAGEISWLERDTVLVFKPAAPFPYGATVVATVEARARSKAGASLTPATGTFTVMPKPPPPPAAPRPRTQSAPIPKPSGGGGAVSGSWTAVESYYLKLMNCTRTGGLVTSSGSCSSPGGRDVAPLKLDAGISSKVSRPYAKLLATRNLCSHFVGGNPGDRLRRAGYTSYRWAENLGCRSGDPYAAVLGSHLYFQAERNWSPVGGHYRNLMSTSYDRAGIGVWVSSGRVRLVVNFYHP